MMSELMNVAVTKRLPDMIGFGDESEAISYVDDYGSAWKTMPNAIAWAASR